MPAIAAVGAFLASGTTAAVITGALIKVALSVALSKLQQAMLKKKLARNGGIATDTTVSGESFPEAFQMGWYATGGHMVCPPMSHGKKNKYLTYVIEVASMPGVALRRLIVDNKYVTLSGTTDATYGKNFTGDHAGKLWLKWYDGSQVAADPMLISKYGARSTRPWTSAMIGAGLTYAILTFVFNEDVYRSMPSVRFEVDGIPLYDPRKDTTVGGSGSHRWATPSTWTTTTNPMVMAYNIQRGIKLPGNRVWGLGVGAADLPLVSWFTAMNACDAVQPTAAGTEPAYRAGTEVMLDNEPADVLDQLMNSCAGDLIDVGGTWKAAAGAPPLPVYAFTDDDVLISNQQDFDPFPGLEETFNGVHARYPDPASIWEIKDAPPRYNATYEAADFGKQLIADLELPTVPYKYQVQRLQKSYIEEERRFRRHVIHLPQDAAVLEPGDTVAWTSTRNGYSAKLFEVTDIKFNLRTLSVAVSLRERDPADYSWTAPEEVAVIDADPDYVTNDPIEVDGFAVVGTSIEDASATARRPAAQFTWTAADLAETEGLDWEIRVQASGAMVGQGTTAAKDSGSLVVSQGLLANVTYEGRMRAVVPGIPTVWTAWTAFTTPNNLLINADLGNNSVDRPNIFDNAVSDQWVTALVPPTVKANGDNILNIAIFPLPLGAVFRRSVRFECKVDWTGTPADPLVQIALYSKMAWGGNPLGPFVTQETWTFNKADTPTGVWFTESQSGSLAGGIDQMQYFLHALFVRSGVTLTIRNCAFSAFNGVK